MKLELSKFGTTLISRELGSEALKAFQPTLLQIPGEEILEIDFSGILTLSPSWADEFLTPLSDLLGSRLILLVNDDLSVQATVNILQEANKKKFEINHK